MSYDEDMKYLDQIVAGIFPILYNYSQSGESTRELARQAYEIAKEVLQVRDTIRHPRS